MGRGEGFRVSGRVRQRRATVTPRGTPGMRVWVGRRTPGTGTAADVARQDHSNLGDVSELERSDVITRRTVYRAARRKWVIRRKKKGCENYGGGTARDASRGLDMSHPPGGPATIADRRKISEFGGAPGKIDVRNLKERQKERRLIVKTVSTSNAPQRRAQNRRRTRRSVRVVRALSTSGASCGRARRRKTTLADANNDGRGEEGPRPTSGRSAGRKYKKIG